MKIASKDSLCPQLIYCVTLNEQKDIRVSKGKKVKLLNESFENEHNSGYSQGAGSEK